MFVHNRKFTISGSHNKLFVVKWGLVHAHFLLSACTLTFKTCCLWCLKPCSCVSHRDRSWIWQRRSQRRSSHLCCRGACIPVLSLLPPPTSAGKLLPVPLGTFKSPKHVGISPNFPSMLKKTFFPLPFCLSPACCCCLLGVLGGREFSKLLLLL